MLALFGSRHCTCAIHISVGLRRRDEHFSVDLSLLVLFYNTDFMKKLKGAVSRDCAESAIEMFVNPKLVSTAQSQTLRRITLRGVKTNFLIFEILHFQEI